MSAGELITRWTIRAALVCLLLVIAERWALPNVPSARSGRMRRIARAVWTLGCVLLLSHMAAAFHFYHAWSHARAYDATARETEELLGVAYGGGIYFNYAFAAVWLLDVAWWWACRECYEARPRWISLGLHGYLFFIAFHGAVVFAEGPIRWVGLALSVLLAILVLGFVSKH